MDENELQRIRSELDEVLRWTKQLHAQTDEAVQRLVLLEQQFKALERPQHPISDSVVAPEAHLEQPVPAALVSEILPEEVPPPPPVVHTLQSSPLVSSMVEPPALSSRQPENTSKTPETSLFQTGFIGLLRKRLDASLQKSRELGWEVALGTFWLPRIAIVLIAIAVVYLLTLAIAKFGGSQWAPHIRVGIGYGVCVGFLFAAWKMEQTYKELTQVLYGGGFALMYFVTYATHYVPFARVVENPLVTLLLLAVIVMGWSVAAHLRKSNTMAFLVALLGHLTILISTLSTENPARFSIAGLLALTVGSAFFLLRHRWYYVASTGMVAGYVNFAVLLYKSHGTDPVPDFIGAMTILAVLLLAFVLAELLAPRELRRESIPAWIRTVFTTVNTALFFVLGTLLVDHNDFSRPHQDWFRFAFAGVLFLIGLAYRFRERDPLFNAFFTKAVAIGTFGLSACFKESSLAVWYAVESVALLVSARQFKLVVSRILAQLVALLALVQTELSLGKLNPIAYDAPEYPFMLFNGGISLLSFLTASLLYQRTDWSSLLPTTMSFSSGMRTILWWLDLIPENPEKRKPLNGLLVPYGYAVAGALVLLVNFTVLVKGIHVFAGLTFFALCGTLAAVFFRSRPFGLFAWILLVVSFPCGIAVGSVSDMLWPVAGLVLFALTSFASETAYVGRHEGLAFHQRPASPYFLYGALAVMFGTTLDQYLNPLAPEMIPACLGVAGIVSAGMMVWLHPRSWTLIAMGFLLVAGGLNLHEHWEQPFTDWNQAHYLTWALVVVLMAGNRYWEWFKSRVRLSGVPDCCVVMAWILGMVYFEWQVTESGRYVAITGTAFAFAAYAGGFRVVIAMAASLIAALCASVRLTMYGYRLEGINSGFIAAYVLLALYWIAAERVTARFAPAMAMYQKTTAIHSRIPLRANHISAIFIALLGGLLLTMFYQLPYLLNANRTLITMGWFALSVGLILLSLVFHEKYYRYCGLIIIVLSIGRVFLIDMRQQDALLRIAAFTLLGVGLLPISYGYHRWMKRLRNRNYDQPPES